jgi:hypothetical protein
MPRSVNAYPEAPVDANKQTRIEKRQVNIKYFDGS